MNKVINPVTASRQLQDFFISFSLIMFIFFLIVYISYVNNIQEMKLCHKVKTVLHGEWALHMPE